MRDFFRAKESPGRALVDPELTWRIAPHYLLDDEII
jgi:hypothetical protein